jgi:deoxyadenosine/deoxycytidine kinase
LERIAQRGRNEEDSIKLEYLEKLHQYHDQWLLNFTKIPVLTLDNESDNNWDFIINKIKSFTDSFVTIPEYKEELNEVTGYSYFD